MGEVRARRWNNCIWVPRVVRGNASRLLARGALTEGVAVVVAVQVGQPILRCPGAAAWERCNSRARSKLAVGAGAPPRAAGAMPITPGDLRNLDHEAPWPLLAWSAGLFARNGFASAQELRGAALVDLEGLQDAPRADYREQVVRLVVRANSTSLGRGERRCACVARILPYPCPAARRRGWWCISCREESVPGFARMWRCRCSCFAPC